MASAAIKCLQDLFSPFYFGVQKQVLLREKLERAPSRVEWVYIEFFGEPTKLNIMTSLSSEPAKLESISLRTTFH